MTSPMRLEMPVHDNPDSIKRYADATWVSCKYVKKKLMTNGQLPCSMLGIPIDKDGECWGVIVLDSTERDGLKERDHFYQAARVTQNTIAQLADQL